MAPVFYKKSSPLSRQPVADYKSLFYQPFALAPNEKYKDMGSVEIFFILSTMSIVTLG